MKSMYFLSLLLKEPFFFLTSVAALPCFSSIICLISCHFGYPPTIKTLLYMPNMQNEVRFYDKLCALPELATWTFSRLLS